jgi:hypothetical protein
MGIQRFIDEVLRPKLTNEYAGMQIRAWGDPAGNQRSQATEQTCMDMLEAAGIPVEAASTQDPAKRREAVVKFLTTIDSDGEPAFIMDPKCRYLRKGFNGAFQFERVQSLAEERFKDQHKKNIYSHVHEGLQYGLMEILEGLSVHRVVARPVIKHDSGGWAA